MIKKMLLILHEVKFILIYLNSKTWLNFRITLITAINGGVLILENNTIV